MKHRFLLNTLAIVIGGAFIGLWAYSMDLSWKWILPVGICWGAVIAVIDDCLHHEQE
jgi:hypothetical protein